MVNSAAEIESSVNFWETLKARWLLPSPTSAFPAAGRRRESVDRSETHVAKKSPH